MFFNNNTQYKRIYVTVLRAFLLFFLKKKKCLVSHTQRNKEETQYDGLICLEWKIVNAHSHTNNEPKIFYVVLFSLKAKILHNDSREILYGKIMFNFFPLDL